MSPSPALDINHVSFTYPHAARSAVEDVTLRLEPGESLGVLGPNGGGKSTLLKLCLGLLTPSTGAIRVLGQSPDAAVASRSVGYLPQRIDADRRFPLSVRDVVSLAAELELPPTAKLTKQTKARIGELLDLVGVQRLASRPIAALSGGELQRVMIARALVFEPKLLILDEPTVGIDITGQERFGDMMRTIRASLDVATVVVSHDIRVIRHTSDRVACLARTLHFHAAPDGLTPDVLAEVFSHDVIGHGHEGSCSACDEHTHEHPATPDTAADTDTTGHPAGKP